MRRIWVGRSVVVCPPGLGDDVQAIKAGILEIADILVVSKADSPQAGETTRDLADMLKLKRATGGWKVPVLPTVAPRDEGVAALVDACDRHAQEVGRGRRTRAPDATDTPAAQLARRFIERDGFVRHCLSAAQPGGVLAPALRTRRRAVPRVRSAAPTNPA